MDEKAFLKILQQKAKNQAQIESSSPVPEFARPFLSIVGMHYWQLLLLISFLVSVPLSVLGFSFVYVRALGL